MLLIQRLNARQWMPRHRPLQPQPRKPAKLPASARHSVEPHAHP
jgi:hypothetical protein